MASELIFREEKNGEAINVAISGEVDIYTSQKLKDKLYSLVDESKSDIRIDFKDLTYIDSTGLGILVGALKKARQKEKNIIISNMRENINKLFLITGLDKLFMIEG
ncbi:anti-anti-sigma factor [Clostridium thermosuccinogenes]|uniref:Anti-sigma factor antagonist n=1 Tax=Clostridium thermosuccinogenes TaxID=84032 RepID=A0A2K2FIT2_9CLOT|nr:STAS domain-containing protein [Pseudoclostridium thermosuccinogenes]AUS98154.1 anti-anti-sigma factor [Pseudoclostridium thermosuccinogenes]PNT91190.1 anti-anti-sigma factor [Pseudoclostridium thermosuccinogenes]PNT96868.1 anti-anti-sigma factor [Pseudoclostridium thermosuccinogenes]PNT98678.1 anti-anti-sigma factor [Pseudoclostridium thermosuccinogenes]